MVLWNIFFDGLHYFIILHYLNFKMGHNMKKTILLLLTLFLTVGSFAQDKPKKAKKEKMYNEKGEIIKKGWNFGPLPVVGYDADLGFQYGVTCDIFNFSDGCCRPRVTAH